MPPIATKWFQTFLDVLTPALLLQTVCCNVKFDTPPCSTSLAPEYVAQKVTEAELRQHTFFTGTKNASEARKQCKKKMKNHGFILFSNRHAVPKTVASEDLEEWDSIFHDKLPAMLKQTAYASKFSPIFARMMGDNNHRFGDRLRLQLKLKKALQIAQRRLSDANQRRPSQKKGDVVEKAKAEYELLVRARALLAQHYRALVQVLRILV
jgi:hypothetical protein